MARYQARDIEVLSGLDPVRKRPGMYTDTQFPDHLAQEVIDNSVDEALAGSAKLLRVTLHEDGSLEVEDDGRGMPVDSHPELERPGAEVILSTLHAGAKFSGRNYRHAGGLHGVGVSVVNALSSKLDVWIKRQGQEFHLGFANGELAQELQPVGSVGARNTGTRLRFLPDPQYFENSHFRPEHLSAVLRAKALLCPGLLARFETPDGESAQWCYEDGLGQFMAEALGDAGTLPDPALRGHCTNGSDSAEWIFCWTPGLGSGLSESYVNLIPTPAGGTHVGMLRSGLAQAARSFAESRGLIPRGVRLTPEDIWNGISYVFSYKTEQPQFSGQTKEKFTGEGHRLLAPRTDRKRVLRLARPARAPGRGTGTDVDRGRPQEEQPGTEGGAQEGRVRPDLARKARGLLRTRKSRIRTVPGRGRFCRRLGAPGA